MADDLTKLLDLVPPATRSALFSSVIPTILSSVSSVSAVLNTAHHVSLAGAQNTFGDSQLNVDVAAEDAVRAALLSAPSIVTVSSEEDATERSITTSSSKATGERYTLAFDPLDGSSIIAPNWTVGAIYGVWDGDTAVGVDAGEKQVAAVLGVFGPRTTAIVAVRVPEIPAFCFEVGLITSGSEGPKIEILRRNVKLSEAPWKTRYFAPANLCCAAESPAYKALIDYYIMNSYTLRYAGGLVPDVVHMLVKGQGVYVNPVTPGTKAKLRALYELFPMALIMECVGGKALDPATGGRILDGKASGCGDKGAFLFGNPEEVDFAIKRLLQLQHD